MEKAELISYFNEATFLPALQARTKEAALEELVNCVVSAGLVRNGAIVLEMVKRREELGSTALNHGVALPHGRTTAAENLMIAFGYSKRGLAWGAMDGKPVHLIFMVLAPPQEQNNKYLPTLGRLVEVLSHSAEREKFTHVTTFAEFTQLLKS
ncbi:MAG: PTS sugar transporter subunit IIA [candidate division KSB1 bacterium]